MDKIGTQWGKSGTFEVKLSVNLGSMSKIEQKTGLKKSQIFVQFGSNLVQSEANLTSLLAFSDCSRIVHSGITC